MKKRIFNFSICAAVVSSLLLSACSHNQFESPMTQLQVRDLQSREFNTTDTKLVMKSMMNVLQDDGFIIKNAVSDLGLLSAEKHMDVENKTHAFLMVALVGSKARWNKQRLLEASANVSEFGNKTRVRINFQTKTMDNFGCPCDVETITNPRIYQEFFDKLSKGIFIQEQNI